MAQVMVYKGRRRDTLGLRTIGEYSTQYMVEYLFPFSHRCFMHDGWYSFDLMIRARAACGARL